VVLVSGSRSAIHDRLEPTLQASAWLTREGCSNTLDFILSMHTCAVPCARRFSARFSSLCFVKPCFCLADHSMPLMTFANTLLMNARGLAGVDVALKMDDPASGATPRLASELDPRQVPPPHTHTRTRTRARTHGHDTANDPPRPLGFAPVASAQPLPRATALSVLFRLPRTPAAVVHRNHLTLVYHCPTARCSAGRCKSSSTAR
jgi:hypothetical protein